MCPDDSGLINSQRSGIVKKEFYLVEVVKCLVKIGQHASWWFIGDLNG